MKEMELIEVINKARLVYIGIWAGFAAICFIIWAILKPSAGWEESGSVVFFALGWFGLIFPMCYLFIIVSGQFFFGFGGWRWVTRKSELKSPPDWYQEPTFGRSLLRESAVSLGILALILILGIIMKLVRG
jgi:hypothetical protein